MVQLLRLLLMEVVVVVVMVVHLLLLFPAHFHVHVLPPPSSASASTAPSPAPTLHAESPAYCCSAQLSHHPPWSVRLRHRADAGPASWPGGALSLGSSGLSAPLLGPILRQKGVRTHRGVARGVVEVNVAH